MMKSFKQYAKEEAPVNSTGAAIDMNPNGKKSKMFKKVIDRRSRYDVKKLFKRVNDK
jgi:hypothetical protein